MYKHAFYAFKRTSFLQSLLSYKVERSKRREQRGC